MIWVMKSKSELFFLDEPTCQAFYSKLYDSGGVCVCVVFFFFFNNFHRFHMIVCFDVIFVPRL